MSESARFPEDLIQAVDYGLAVPVELVRAAICEGIERKYPLARDEASENLETFDNVPEALLGTDAKNLHNNLGLPINEDGNWKLVHYVNRARKAQVSA
jgi:hypothetical protein